MEGERLSYTWIRSWHVSCHNLVRHLIGRKKSKFLSSSLPHLLYNKELSHWFSLFLSDISDVTINHHLCQLLSSLQPAPQCRHCTCLCIRHVNKIDWHSGLRLSVAGTIPTILSNHYPHNRISSGNIFVNFCLDLPVTFSPFVSFLINHLWSRNTNWFVIAHSSNFVAIFVLFLTIWSNQRSLIAFLSLEIKVRALRTSLVSRLCSF